MGYDYCQWNSTKKLQMKKAILYIFLMSFIGMANAQVLNKDKSQVTKQKDTIKKETKIAASAELFSNDTIVVLNGKYRLFKKDAHASYYANKFNGKKTASGKKFSNNNYTAAHRKLPFGTILKVTNEVNGKFVIVEVTDRGPFSKGREIDLTKKAFMEIASNKNSGGFKVKIEILEQ